MAIPLLSGRGPVDRFDAFFEGKRNQFRHACVTALAPLARGHISADSGQPASCRCAAWCAAHDLRALDDKLQLAADLLLPGLTHQALDILAARHRAIGPAQNDVAT